MLQTNENCLNAAKAIETAEAAETAETAAAAADTDAAGTVEAAEGTVSHNAPATAAKRPEPYSSALEYLTGLIDCFHALARFRAAKRKADSGGAPLRKRRGYAAEADEEPADPDELARRAALLQRESDEVWASFRARAEATLREGCADLPLERLAAEHGLDATEKNILGLAAALSLDPHLEQAVGELVPQSPTDVRAYMEILGDSTEDRIKMRRYFISSGKLVSKGLLALSHYRGMMSEADFYSMDVELPRRVSSILLGEYDVEDQIAGFSSLVEPSVGIESVVLPPEKKQEVLDLVSRRDEYLRLRNEWGFDEAISYGRGVVVLFSGPSGTGKTMLAHALAKATGRRLLLADVRKAVAGRSGDFEENLALLFHEARLMRAILFFDEADEMFGDRSFNGLMPTLLREFERMDGIAILATNRKQVLDEALERRILYKMDFEPPTAELRERIWRVHLPGKAPLAPDVDPAALAEEYDFVGGLIKNAVLVALNRALSRNGDAPAITQADLLAGAELQRRNLLERHADKVVPKVSLDDVALPDGVKRQVESLVKAARLRLKVYRDWGFGRKLTGGKALTALFYGPPGTGKTMCAEAVAQALGQNLYPVSLPSVVSKYVGETAKNLRQVFQDAKEAGAVLFFDEADALFAGRLDEASSNARFVNGEIDALLQEMERHDGVVVLATNREEALDPAFERRLRYRVEFPRPDAEAREAIWRGLLPPEAPSGEIDFAALARKFDLCGGDIKNAVLRAAFAAASENGTVTQELLERSAQEETPLRQSGPVGFASCK